MIRLLGALVALAPLALGLVVLTSSNVLDAWLEGGSRTVLGALVAGTIGVSLTALVVAAYLRFRIAEIVAAVELIARGEHDAEVPIAGHGVEGRLARAVADVARQLSATRESASVDRLTGVANRQTLIGALWAEVERANRYDRPFSVAFVDIDHFKQVNDTYGHASGDLVLRGIAQAIQANVRRNDRVGRYGGEEFLVLLPETGVEDAVALCEKLRNLVGRLTFAVEGNPALAMTISIGVAGGIGRSLGAEALVRDADAAMYSAKALGRNQTYVFVEPDDEARVPRAPISPQGRSRAHEVGRLAREAAETALVSLVEPRSEQPGRASPLIASVAVAMASQLDLSDQEIERVRVAALLHDIGKVAMPEEILQKPATLTSAEWQTVVQHPRVGQVILEQATFLREAVPIILHHHERYSGHGYPFGLRGSDIPLGARIVAIADAYEAMTHDRPYKRAIGHDRALEELKRHAGTQFDPELVHLFCELYADAPPPPDGVLPPVAAVARRAAETSRSRTSRRTAERAADPGDARAARGPSASAAALSTAAASAAAASAAAASASFATAAAASAAAVSAATDELVAG